MNEKWETVNGYVLRMIQHSFVIHVTNLIWVNFFFL